jgi:FlaA1/EpsC-like NDP-sugar epimerase
MKLYRRLFEKTAGLPDHLKAPIRLLLDAMLLALAFVVAMVLRLDSTEWMARGEIWLSPAVAIPVSLLVFDRLGFYRIVLRYISSQAFRHIVIGAFLSGLILFAAAQLLDVFMPRSVPLIYMIVAICLIACTRFLWRAVFRMFRQMESTNVLIYGAGSTGRQLAASLLDNSIYRLVGFVDDDPTLQRLEISGFKVYSRNQIAGIIEREGVKVVLLAMPRTSRTSLKNVIQSLEKFEVQVRTVPTIRDIASGALKIDDFREVSIEDLLGREPVPPRQELMHAQVRGKSVMVTGAAGSIGSELCRKIVQLQPARLTLFDASEFGLYAIERELRETLGSQAAGSVEITPVLGNIQDKATVSHVMARHGVQTLYHAAAYKHVPLVEMNVDQGIRNNVFGTQCVCDAAIETGVEAVILISTDKAVRPTNVMGASKRLAELICQAHALAGSRTLFTMVRFGNVLGSSGSVIPLFSDQIKRGGPLTVTHPDITRYFMTIPEAAELVIQAGAMGQGGDVFVLDMGEAVKIVDLARRMLRLHGLRPYCIGTDEKPPENIPSMGIKFTGLRPGEKLYEELLIDANAAPTSHPRIRTAHELSLDWQALSAILSQLDVACKNQDGAELHRILLEAPLGFAPTS